MTKNPWRGLFVALLVAVVGTALWLAWARSRPAPVVVSPPAPDAPPLAAPERTAASWYTPLLSADLEVSPREMSPGELEAFIRGGVDLALGDSIPDGERRQALIQAVASQMGLIASGSFDEYVERIIERKGALPFDHADPKAVSEARMMFDVSAAPTAGKRFSIASIVVRKHEASFAWEPFAEGAVAVVTANRSRYPLTGIDEESELGPCYEFVVPIEHEFRNERRVLALGLRFIWSPASGAWIPISAASYGGTSADAVMFPPL